MQVMDEKRALKRNQSGSGRSKAVVSDEEQARPGPLSSSGASSSSQLLGFMSSFSILSYKTCISYLFSLYLDSLICKLRLLMIVYHHLLGLV